MRNLAELEGKSYDIAIVGGGINGASAAQELAAAGYSVILIEKNDFGSGSSSRSSRLLHCGLRYLAPGKSLFEFVRHPTRFFNALRMAGQAMEARSEILRTSPSRTNLMRFCFPLFEASPYKGWQLDVAFKLMWALGPKDLPLKYRRISRKEAASVPLVKSLSNFDKLRSVAMFDEYQLDWPERICVDSLLDAERLGADILNHTNATIVSRQKDRWILELSTQAEPPVTRIDATAVLNMSGVWIDSVNRTLEPSVKSRVTGTKGCHILVRLPPECADFGIATLNSKMEPFYCIPWRGYHYFGPTETLYEGDKDRVVTTIEERAFLIGEANRILPGFKLSESDVLMTWAGIRPLTFDPDQPLGNRARTIHDLSAEGLDNLFALTAGPVMSYRSAGRAFVSALSSRVKPERIPAKPDYSPPHFPDNQNSPALLSDNAYIKLSDLQHAARVEHARSLTDVLFRRVGVAWDCALSDVELARAADAVGSVLGWDETRRSQEIANYRADVGSLFQPRPELRPS